MSLPPAQLFISFTAGVKNFFTYGLFPFFAILSLIFFLWGVGTAIVAHASDQYEEGKRLMKYGFLGVIIFGILWGLFYFSLAPDIVPANFPSSSQ